MAKATGSKKSTANRRTRSPRAAIPAAVFPEQLPRGEPDKLPGPRVLMADGNRWAICPGYFLPNLDAIRDSMFQCIITGRKFNVSEIVESACLLLWANYDLTADDARFLVLSTMGDETLAAGLVKAVTDSLVINYAQEWTFSEWQRTAFVVAGVDPRSVPTAMVPALLAHLIASGRVASPSSFVLLLKQVTRRNDFMKAAMG